MLTSLICIAMVSLLFFHLSLSLSLSNSVSVYYVFVPFNGLFYMCHAPNGACEIESICAFLSVFLQFRFKCFIRMLCTFPPHCLSFLHAARARTAKIRYDSEKNRKRFDCSRQHKIEICSCFLSNNSNANSRNITCWSCLICVNAFFFRFHSLFYFLFLLCMLFFSIHSLHRNAKSNGK